jgi:hypothetical protein
MHTPESMLVSTNEQGVAACSTAGSLSRLEQVGEMVALQPVRHRAVQFAEKLSVACASQCQCERSLCRGKHRLLAWHQPQRKTRRDG